MRLGATQTMKLHVIMASHNRRDLTVRAIKRAAESAAVAGIRLSFTIYDDGSTDGTREAVSGLPVSVTLMEGDGSAYWARSMAIAEQSALADAAHDDWIVWMNDDILLDIDAFQRARASMREEPDHVFAAAFSEPESDLISYGGYRRLSNIHPLRLRPVPPQDRLLDLDTINGNLVFIPVHVIEKIGGIDGRFSHAAADTDFGLRCRARGVRIRLLSGTFGTCPRNVVTYGNILEDWKSFTSVKGGGNPSSLRLILSLHAPLIWPALWITTYSLWWFRRLTRTFQRQPNSTTKERRLCLPE
jgi:GT2 family glycosyltransferase